MPQASDYRKGPAASKAHPKQIKTVYIVIAVIFFLLSTPIAAVERTGVDRDFILIPGGCFEMGCGPWTGSCDKDEIPAHEVCVDNFYLGTREISVGEFRVFAESSSYKTDAEKMNGCFYWTGIDWEKKNGLSWRNPGFVQTDDDPVVCVSWQDVIGYILWKSRKDKVRYRLPTEAEWEYAARGGGKRIRYSWGEEGMSGNIANSSMRSKFSAWPWPFAEGYEDGKVFTAPGGSFPPNPLGLFDMGGNVEEWIADHYMEDYYARSPRNAPRGPAIGDEKVIRGGSWLGSPRFVRLSKRKHSLPWGRSGHLGFRMARSPSPRRASK